MFGRNTRKPLKGPTMGAHTILKNMFLSNLDDLEMWPHLTSSNSFLWNSSIIHLFVILYITAILDIFFTFGHLTPYLNHLSPLQGNFLGKSKGCVALINAD